MAKLTLSGLQQFAKTYVDASKQAGAWKETHNNLYKVLDKVGKMVMLDGNFNDPLAGILDGNSLPLAKTIEEYMIDLTTPIDFKDPSSVASDFAEAALKPYLPTTEAASYSITLGRKVIPTTIPYDNVERGCINSSVAANMITKVSEKLEQSASLYRYQLKKQLLGNAAEKAITAGLSEILPAPTDATSGEKWIKTIKERIEDASFANEGNCISKTLIGAAPKGELVLFVKKGVQPDLEVNTESGAFHTDKLALPCRVIVLDDFGAQTNASKINAILVDTRGVKLHDGYIATRAQENGFSDYVNIFKHSEYTGFISKYTYIRVFKQN